MFFSKKSSNTKVRDVVWINSESKWKGVEYLWNKDPNTMFIFWFDETFDEAKALLNNNISLSLAREINQHHVIDKPVVFVEHYPLQKKEQELFQRLQLKEAKVLSALDEPLFKKFGSDKIIGMLKQMGMKENDPLENSMISNAIKNAQQKLEKQVMIEHSATSQQSWLNKNIASQEL